jgi:hypothetical protein
MVRELDVSINTAHNVTRELAANEYPLAIQQKVKRVVTPPSSSLSFLSSL